VFLVTLLLPLVLADATSRHPVRPQAAIRNTLMMVTAFTLAHSITLSLAVLSVVTLPAKWVEVGIALSVVIASLNNLSPAFPHARWLFPFGFGLIHGFGFANALVDLGLPAGTLTIALLGFNLGVETGQVVIVLALVPALVVFARTRLYRPLVLRGGSAAIAVISAVCCVERLGVTT